MAPRAVLLDLGNVFAFHDNDLWIRRMAERAGRDPGPLAEVLARELWDPINRGQIPEREIRGEVCARLGVEIDPDDFFALWSCHFTLHEAVLPLVEPLVGRVRLALVSNTNALHVRYLLPKLPILHRFDALVLSHELGAAKPDPAIFRAALDAVGVQPAEAVFFDDLPAYVEAARRLGIDGRLFTDAPRFEADLRALGLCPPSI